MAETEDDIRAALQRWYVQAAYVMPGRRVAELLDEALANIRPAAHVATRPVVRRGRPPKEAGSAGPIRRGRPRKPATVQADAELVPGQADAQPAAAE